VRAVIQRVEHAKVTVEERTVASMDSGLLVLLAAGQQDTESVADWMADKIINLRVFPDDAGKMNLSLKDTAGQMIVVSQFTLYGDCRKGRRPSFVGALEPDAASRLVDRFVLRVNESGIVCSQGVFGAHMKVDLLNDGPVTLLLDSAVSRHSAKGGFSVDNP